MGCCQSHDVDTGAHATQSQRPLVLHSQDIRKRYAESRDSNVAEEALALTIRKRFSESSESSLAESDGKASSAHTIELSLRPVEPVPLDHGTTVATAASEEQDKRKSIRKRTEHANSPPRKRPAHDTRGMERDGSQATLTRASLTLHHQLLINTTSTDDFTIIVSEHDVPAERPHTLSDDITEILAHEPSNLSLEDAQGIASRHSLDKLLASLDSAGPDAADLRRAGIIHVG